MGTQEKPPSLQAITATHTNLRDGLEGKSWQKFHSLRASESFAPGFDDFRACKTPDDTAPAHHSTSSRLLQREDDRTASREYEAFFQVTLSDGGTVNLLAPNETRWEGDTAAQEAVKFIEDPAAELEAFLLAFARSQ